MRPTPRTARLTSIPVLAGLVVLFATCTADRSTDPPPAWDAGAAPRSEPRPDPTESRFCARCHPAIYAEHTQNTHGRAFHDQEARLATRGFRRDDCIRCHTPRPVAETGIGMTPMARWTNLDEGNTCMSCHAKPGEDYSGFAGGAECRNAFDLRVGTVAHCATCHRIAGTPEQWSRAAFGKSYGNVCIDCHMPFVLRPVAVGESPRRVRSHVFPASRSASQLARAYRYDAAIDGNEVVVRITNEGVGHNFPTANRQRAVESLVVVHDEDGQEIGRSRLVCRYPYALELGPHQMTMPVSTQIPSGETREHRVPIPVATGFVECRLFFKTYRPSDDDDPALSRCLEERRIPFTGIEPSDRSIVDAPFVGFPAPATDLNDFLDPDGVANVVRPAPGSGPVAIPATDSPEDVTKLTSMLESHLPEVRRRAKDRLVEIGPDALPQLVQALGRWSNESFNGAKAVLVRIGAPAVPALVAAMQDDSLYVRIHAREVLGELGFPSERAEILADLERATRAPHPLDRRSAALALGELGDPVALPSLRALVSDPDPDVLIAAARALASLDDRDTVPALERALGAARQPESKRELAVALATLGSAAGIPALLDGLGAPDPLVREAFFERFFAVTGVHLGYEPDGPDVQRLEALARLESWAMRHPGPDALRTPPAVDPAARARAWGLVEQLGGGTDTVEAKEGDTALLGELVAMGDAAVPALIEGLTFPTGFADKRALVCQALGQIGNADAAPWLAATLRDPVPAVAEWACWALEAAGDAATIPQIREFERRVPWQFGRAPTAGDASPADRVLARAARTRLMLGDETGREDLVNMLVSESLAARQIAIGALAQESGDTRGYAADASPDERLAAAARWRE